MELAQSWVVGAATGLFVLVALFLARDGWANRALATTGILFCAGAASRALLSEPTVGTATDPLRVILTILCVGHAAAFLTFTRLLFADGGRIRQHDLIIWATLVALGLLVFRGEPILPEVAALKPLFASAEIAAAAAALTIAWRGIAGDLVEARRKARFAFAAIASLHVATIGLTEVALNSAPLGDLGGLINVCGLLAVAIGLSFAIGGLQSEYTTASLHLANRDLTRGRRLEAVATRIAATPDLDAIGAQLFDKLNRMMELERVYRDETLTVRSLASRLSIREHVLREMINRRLGYRNFNEYLNARRLSEVRDALLDPEQIDVPISTMALDAGFRSLGPFNRAFRAAQGMTPTEYRRRFATSGASEISSEAISG